MADQTPNHCCKMLGAFVHVICYKFSKILTSICFEVQQRTGLISQQLPAQLYHPREDQ